MNKKKEVLISLLYLLGKVWGRTYIQKFVYLVNREIFDNKLFTYEFYKYGPFSEEINQSISELEDEGIIVEKPIITKGLNTAYTYELTKKGNELASNTFSKGFQNKTRDALLNYANKFRNFTPTELLKYVYEKYPEVTENSVFKDN